MDPFSRTFSSETIIRAQVNRDGVGPGGNAGVPGRSDNRRSTPFGLLDDYDDPMGQASADEGPIRTPEEEALAAAEEAFSNLTKPNRNAGHASTQGNTTGNAVGYTEYLSGGLAEDPFETIISARNVGGGAGVGASQANAGVIGRADAGVIGRANAGVIGRADAGRSNPNVGSLNDIVNMVVSMKQVAEAVKERILDKNGRMKEDLPLSEGRSAISTLTSIAVAMAKLENFLKSEGSRQIFEASVISVLKKMDDKHRTEYMQLLSTELEINGEPLRRI